MQHDLKNCTICVTGASSGVGAAIAAAFAREGAKVHCVVGPGSKDDNKEECSKLAEKLGGAGIDCLVNNAGIFGPSGEDQGPLKGDTEEWHGVIHTNLLSAMILTRHLAPKMVEKGEGYILNIGDVEGYHSGPHHPVYAASKAGLRGFSNACYETLRDKGVHVTLIEPGNIKHTKMMETTDKAHGQGAIDPDDVAQACMFPFRVSNNCVPSEIVLKALKPNGS